MAGWKSGSLPVISPCHLTGEGRPSHVGNTRFSKPGEFFLRLQAGQDIHL